METEDWEQRWQVGVSGFDDVEDSVRRAVSNNLLTSRR
jgi:hypothetical protein